MENNYQEEVIIKLIIKIMKIAGVLMLVYILLSIVYGAFIEINYLDYIVDVKKMRFSPFVFTGLGMSYYPDEKGKGIVTPNIPLGVGIKYAITDKLSFGAEASLRKLFNDGLDNLNNPYQEVGLQKVSDILHNNDWISYFGLTLSYKFYWGKKPCPAYESVN